MRAVRATPDGVLVQDVPVPDPGPGEVLVKVAGAGLCHSDCMIRHNPQVYLPEGGSFTLGHETAGWVEAVGPGVRKVVPGQAVVVHAEYGCGECSTCLGGNQRYCPAIKPRGGAGLGFDGGLAEYICAPSHAIVVLPEGVDPVDAGPLDDAGLTPYHAIRTSMPWLEAGSLTTVIGIGGLGHLAIQILKAVSPTTIVAVEPNADRRRFALELGADLAIDPDDDAAAQIHGRGGASLVLDLVGIDATLALGAASVARQGKLMCVGAGLGSVPFGLIHVPWEVVCQNTYSGEAWELEQLLQLAAAGKVHVESTHITLDQVADAYDILDRGEHGTGRMIAVP